MTTVIYLYYIKKDIYKIDFRCPHSLGIYEWVTMSFNLMNTSVTY